MKQVIGAWNERKRIHVSGQAWKVLGATALTNFVVGLDISITNVAIPDLQRMFQNASTSDLSWAVTFYLVIYAGFLIVAGRWADRYGRLRVLNIGLVCFVVGACLAALAPSVLSLIAMKGLQGLGAAIMTPASLGIAIAAWPSERRASAVAIWSSTFAISSAVGPVLGGLLIELGSWRWAFSLNIPIGLLALILGSRILPQSKRDPGTGTPDLLGSALITVGTVALALAIVQGRVWGWLSAEILALLAITIVSISIVTRRITDHPDPIVPKLLFSISSFRIASITTFLFGLGFFAVILTLVLYLDEIANYTTIEAGLAISMLPIAAAVSSNICGRLADRFGFRAVTIPGMLLFTTGSLWLWARAGVNPNYLADLFPGFLLLGTGIGAGPPILAGAGVSDVGPIHFSVAGAVNQTARQLSGALGVAIVVAILGPQIGNSPTVEPFQRAFLYLAAVAVVASLVATRLTPHHLTRSLTR